MAHQQQQRTVPPCPVCDYCTCYGLFQKSGRDFWACGHCGLVRQYTVPRADELNALYESELSLGLYLANLDSLEIELRAQWRLDKIYDFCRRGRWLDIGCAGGEFVAEALHRSLDAEGIDLSPTAVSVGMNRGLLLKCSTIEDYDPAYRFDTITGFDIIEHLPDPLGWLTVIAQRLAPGGTLALTTPDLGSWSHRMMGRRWPYYIPDQHLFYFDRSTIRMLLARTGFEVVHVTRACKYISCHYALNEFKATNPRVYQLLSAMSRIFPRSLWEHPWRLYVGEMLVIARAKETYGRI